MLTTDLSDSYLWNGFAEECPALGDYISENRQQIACDLNTKLLTTLQGIFRPKLKMRVDQCSDKFRYIPPNASANFGKFWVKTFEIARGPMAAVTEPGVRKITVAGPTQLLKTTLLESTALYYMIIDPKPMMFMQPNKKLLDKFSKQKINGMINSTPAAQKVMFKTTLEEKPFLGGTLAISNAGSKSNMAMMAACITAADETDKMPDLDGSHPVFMLEKRSSSFGDDARNLRVCSPEFETGFIWKEYLSGDQRQPYVVCPHCDHDHVMRWRPTELEKEDYLKRHGKPAPDRNVIWVRDAKTGNAKLETAAYHCPECGVGWTMGERLKAISKVKWRQTKPFTCCPDKLDQGGGYQQPELWQDASNWEPTVDPSDGYEIVGRAKCRCCNDLAVPNFHASFNCSRLYSPNTLNELVMEFLQAKSSSQGLKQFENDELGLPWLDRKAIQISAEGLRAREEHFEYEMPERAVMVTAGVDTQGDRLEAEKVAWGRELENWSIDYQVFEGDPALPEVWKKLDKWLNTPVVGKDGRKFMVAATCIDTQGNKTQHVYRYCALRQNQRIWAIRGGNEQGRQMFPIWPKSPTYVAEYNLPLRMIGTTAAKNLFLGDMLPRTMPGPLFCHFPTDRDQTWYNAVLSEKQVIKEGLYRWELKQDGTRNEALDCRVYAIAALVGLRAEFQDPFLVEKRADELGIGRTLTDFELQKFAIANEAFRIEQETKRAIEQNRAKPINKGATKRVVGDRKPIFQEPEMSKLDPDVATFAKKSDNRVSSQTPGQPKLGNRRPPGRKAPFSYKKR